MKNKEKQAKVRPSNVQLRPFLSNKSMAPKIVFSIVVQISHLRLRKKNRLAFFPTVSIRCFHGKKVMTVCSLNASLFVDGRSVISLTAKGSSNGKVQKWWRPSQPSWRTSQSWWRPSQQCGNILHIGKNILKLG